jgi:hypothetical protein
LSPDPGVSGGRPYARKPEGGGVMTTNRKPPTLTIVAGTDWPTVGHAPRADVAAKMQDIRKERKHGDRSDDPIFFEIERHRRAVKAHDKALDAQNAAEGKVSAEEFAYLQHCTGRAFDEMMLFARAIVIFPAQSRAGLIALAKYLERQFNDRDGCENGCMYMPDDINGQLWPHVFMRSLASSLRRMGAEFPKKATRPGRKTGKQ